MAALAIEYQPLTTILLFGQLRQFGRSFKLSVRTPAEAIKALCVQIPGFERFLSNAKSRGIEFAVFRGKKNIGQGELGYGGEGEIRIAPVITGSKRGGILQTIVGVVLLCEATVVWQAMMDVGWVGGRRCLFVQVGRLLDVFGVLVVIERPQLDQAFYLINNLGGRLDSFLCRG